MADSRGSRLAGKVAIVTGGAGAIGRVAATRFAEEGAAVGVVDLDGEGAAIVAAEIVATGGVAVAVSADVGVRAAAREAVQRCVRELGPIDVLFNNAGLAMLGGVAELEPADWERCLRTNVIGTANMSAEVLARMPDGGAIVNQASVSGLVGIERAAAYSAAKGAVIALTRQMAVDLAPRIRVNCLCPGTVETPLVHELFARRGQGDAALGKATTVGRYPLGRLGAAEDVAAAALFLAGPDSAFCTGTTLVVDGGMTII